jgi:anaphase-promoting complex subunit 5
MEEPETPPTPNTLRPHHISLLMVIMLLYRHYPRKRFHPSFLIQVHRVLLEEVVEVRLLIDTMLLPVESPLQVTPPRSFPKLLEVLKSAPHSDDDGAIPFFESLKPKVVKSP